MNNTLRSAVIRGRYAIDVNVLKDLHSVLGRLSKACNIPEAHEIITELRVFSQSLDEAAAEVEEVVVMIENLKKHYSNS